MSDFADEIRSYWDIDSATYDDSQGHKPRSALELAAWSGTLARLLPPAPARVLDVGAGTGFLSVLLAQLGYKVKAVDVSSGMLARLKENAAAASVDVETIEADAVSPPASDFDVVVERHLLWTLPDPRSALVAWRKAAPTGRLVLVETLWGSAGGTTELLRGRARAALALVRRTPPDHHAEYEAELRSSLPLGSGASPAQLVELVQSTPWGLTRVERLRDVEWATRAVLPSSLDRLIGLPPRFAVVAGA
jgi:SAM-dependent methyltransferase